MFFFKFLVADRSEEWVTESDQILAGWSEFEGKKEESIIRHADETVDI